MGRLPGVVWKLNALFVVLCQCQHCLVTLVM